MRNQWTLSFYSKLVRLKAEAEQSRTDAAREFLFQTGAIKRVK